MRPSRGDPVALLRRSYAAGEDVDFGRFVAVCGTDSDDLVADLIDADARERIDRGREVDLDRYLSSVPGIRERPEVLDTAIEMALLALVRSKVPGEEAARTLAVQHPELVDAIGTAAVLADALVSTQRLSKGLKSSKPRKLPQDFGPVLEDGEQRYELRELLGAGSQGSVFLAVDRRLSEDQRPAWVAIKVLPDALSAAEDRRRLAEEAKKARSIVHPNVVRVLDRGVTPQDEEYVVFEHVPGGTLRSLMDKRSEPMPVREAAALAMGIARGVQAIHSAGLVHCDLKPDNVLIGEDGAPRVTDFGIAIRRRGRLAEGGTERGRRGNLGFMAPEQVDTDGTDISSAADIYALGALLYWLLTQKVPNGDTPEEALRRLREASEAAGREGGEIDWPPGAESVRAGVDRDLSQVQRRAMAIRPRARYASAEAMATDLDSWLRHEVIAWTRPGIARRSRLFLRRDPKTAAAIAVMCVMALGAVAWTSRLQANARAEREELRARAVAEQAELRAKEAAAREAEAQITINVAQRWTRTMLANVRLDGDRLAEEWLPFVTFFESMYGPIFTGLNEDKRLWEIKTVVADQNIRDLEARGGADWLETQQWKLTHGFWLAQDGQFDAALDVLDDVPAKLRRWFTESEPFLLYAEGIVEATRVLRDAEAGRPFEGDAAAVADMLERMREPLGTNVRHTPVSTYAARALISLYGPENLDRPERRRELTEATTAAPKPRQLAPNLEAASGGN